MLEGKALEAALNKVQSIFDSVNVFYIEKIAKQIAKIGKLSQTSINRLRIMAEMTSDVDEITKRLVKATGKSEAEVVQLYAEAMNEAYTDDRFKRAFSKGLKLPPSARQKLVGFTQNVAMQTLGNLENLAQTTIIEQTYRDAVDRAIFAVGSGLGSYNEAIRDTLRQIGMSGIVVQYPSGYKRSLDSAVRQNVIDGTKQVAQNGAHIIGDALGYDAVEISAHMHSAPDHEPVQGRIFLKEEYDKMQRGFDCKDWKGRHYTGFKRPIAQWNCMHFALPFSTEYSVPRYTERQLREWQEANQAGCIINGRHYTTYEASQIMRGIESTVRGLKNTANAAKITGDDILRRECQWKINQLVRKYQTISDESGLTEQRDRMSVAGFRAVKAVKQIRKTREKADNVTVNSLESLKSIAQTSSDKYDFWGNLSESQQQIVKSSGKPFDEVYEMLSAGKKELSEWKEANPGGPDDFNISYDFSGMTTRFNPVMAKGDGWMAEAGTAGTIYVRDSGLGDDWKDIMTHEAGHQLSAIVPELNRTIALNPGNVFGRYNTRVNAFAGVYGEYNPEEAFATSVNYYINYPDDLLKKYPDAYKALDTFFKASPSARAFIERIVKQYEREYRNKR